jgi:hypothetical protein
VKLDTIPQAPDLRFLPNPVHPFLPENEAELSEFCRETFALQTIGLGERMLRCRAKKMVLGISGGLDSTLALVVLAFVCRQYGFPADTILAVTMPGFGTTGRTKNNALKLAEVLGAEIREAGDHKDDLNYLLQQYLTGPKTEALYSPFPAGTKLVRLEQNEETLNIILDSTFAELSGLKLTLACAGLTRTCLELAPVDTVQISADGPTLDGKRSIIMDRHALELIDRAVDNSTYPTEIQEAS